VDTGRSDEEAQAKALARKREREATIPNVQRILDILNFRPPKTRRRLYGDPRTGMDYETLFECKEELGELMESWLAAGCRVDRWPLRERLEADLNRRRIRLLADRSNEGRVAYEFGPLVREEFDLGLGGGYKADIKPGRTHAVSLFFQFITGPFQRDVGRCKRCRNYWWNRWHHPGKIYCSSKCSSADTATRITRERREKDHQEKLQLVEAAMKSFEQLPAAKQRRLGWKRWVKQEAGPDVSLHFITRAINRGEIKAPKGLARK